ncbi:hypothetical protein MtrunA17_Chr8g0358341 [Medicago truncatula]|uniref:Transmembrane protein n=1 Tax=Medicago truncatula TaxID=3880 RepID=A0A396GJQ3_MEDTR|nr:hypothetical protein MtrunA17_Chr8g0358341 [Medicago truncatula]
MKNAKFLPLFRSGSALSPSGPVRFVLHSSGSCCSSQIRFVLFLLLLRFCLVLIRFAWN